jgi:uncharacterized membrane protein YgcG
MVNVIEKNWLYMQERMQKLNETLTSTLEAGIEDTIISLASAFGKNLVDGDPFKDLGLVLLSSLGNLMKTMGAAMIAWGVNLAVFEANISNPAVAIAAGAALVIAGSAISKIASEGMKGTGGSSGGGGSYGGGGNYSNPVGDMVLVSRLDGRDLVISYDRTTYLQRR